MTKQKQKVPKKGEAYKNIRVKLEEVTLAVSALTKRVFVGSVNEEKGHFKHKKDITEDFIATAIAYFKEKDYCDYTFADGQKFRIMVHELEPATEEELNKIFKKGEDLEKTLRKGESDGANNTALDEGHGEGGSGS